MSIEPLRPTINVAPEDKAIATLGVPQRAKNKPAYNKERSDNRAIHSLQHYYCLATSPSSRNTINKNHSQTKDGIIHKS